MDKSQPTTLAYPSYRFDIKETKKWKSHIDEFGFAVVSGMISPKEALEGVTELKTVLTKLSPALKMNDEKSWTKSKNYPYMHHGGMIQYIGHTKTQWKFRENVAPVFAELWDCEPEDLATSFDGFCYMDGRRGYPQQELCSFIHTDQGPKDPFVYQGLVNLCPNGENDGGFVCIPKSHKKIQEIFKQLGMDNYEGHCYNFSEEDKKHEIFKEAIKVCAEPGDFIVWDSRTLHCNTTPSNKNPRCCVYICQVRQDSVPSDTRKMRDYGWKNKRCTPHHQDETFKLFPEYPKGVNQKDFKQVVAEVSTKDLSKLQKSLLCNY